MPSCKEENRKMLQSQLIDQLARQRVAELHDAACRERLNAGMTRLPRARVYASRTLIALGTRLAPEGSATNRMSKLAGR
jgi:hypothetical protein